MFPIIFILALLVSPALFQDPNPCQPNVLHQGYVPHSTECKLYHLCSNGAIKSDRQCETGKTFDMYDLMCKSAGVICYPGDAATDVTCANIPGHTEIPSATNCRQYATCPNGNTLLDCPPATPFFNYRRGECVTEAEAFCYPGSSKDTTNPTPNPQINTCVPNTAFTYLMPISGYCGMYVTCAGGVSQGELECPDETPVFDYHRLQCVEEKFADCYPGKDISCDSKPFKDGAPNPDDCSMYTDCSVEPPVEKTCDSGTPYFDYRTGKCTTEGDVELLCYPGTKKDPVITAGCGDTHTTRNGVISFKPNEQLTPNQRCVWTINLSGASKFDLTLVSPAGPSADINIMLVTVDRVSGQNAHFFHRPMNETSVSMNGSSLIIILHTKDSATPQGFELTYHVTLQGIPYRQTHNVLTSSQTQIQTYNHPKDGTNYADDEASLIIFAPTVIPPTFKVTTKFTPIEMEANCLNDRIWVLQFNASLFPSWNEKALCYNTAMWTQDFLEMAVFFFESDDKLNGKGFSLEFTVA